MMEAFLDFCVEYAFLFLIATFLLLVVVLITSIIRGFRKRKKIRNLEAKLKKEDRKQRAFYQMLAAWNKATAGCSDEMSKYELDSFDQLCVDGGFTWESLMEYDGYALPYDKLKQHMHLFWYFTSVQHILVEAREKAHNGKYSNITSRESFNVTSLQVDMEKRLAEAKDAIEEFLSTEVYAAFAKWARDTMEELVSIGQKNKAEYLVELIRLGTGMVSMDHARELIRLCEKAGLDPKTFINSSLHGHWDSLLVALEHMEKARQAVDVPDDDSTDSEKPEA